MTDTRFSVRLDELGATVSRLGVLEHHLAQASGRVRAAEAREVGDVAWGLEEFGSHWKHGLNNLHKTVHELHAALSVAHSGYADHETQLGQVLEGRG